VDADLHAGTLPLSTLPAAPTSGPVVRPRRTGPHSIPARPPVPGAPLLRIALASCLAVLCVVTLAGGVLLLLLWQQDQGSTILGTQVRRTWDLVEGLATAQRLIAVVAVPFAVGWMGLSTLNVCRATSRRRYPVAVALTIPVGIVGVWMAGDRVVAPSDDWRGQAAGIALQALALALPLVAFEYVAGAADARRNPMRAAYVLAVVYLVHVQLLAGLWTVEFTADPDEWGLLAAYLVIAALLQVLGTLAVNEGCRSLDDAAEHRYEMRHQFATGVLSQAAARPR
jgi:hypothetical protein